MKTPISMGPCNQHMHVTCDTIDFALLRDESSNFGTSSDEVREENRYNATIGIIRSFRCVALCR
jgi:hypothetical protein